MQNVRLSIIMPAFNSEKTIIGSVKSVLANSSSDFELIVINDGSTDSTEEIIKGFDDPRLVYISKENSGVSATRNYGLEKARGEYVTFIDSDDIYVDGAVDRIIEYIDKYFFDMLGFGFYSEFVKGGKTYKTDANSISETLVFSISEAEKELRYIFESSHIMLQTSWNKVFRREIMVNNNIRFNEKLVCYENLTMIFEYLCHADKIVFTNDILYKYNNFTDKPINVINKRRKLELTEDVSACYKRFIALCDAMNYSKSYRDYMNACFLEDYIFCSRKYFDKSGKFSKSERFNAFISFLNDEAFAMLRREYLDGMTFYRLLFKLNDIGFKHIAYKIYEKKLVK